MTDAYREIRDTVVATSIDVKYLKQQLKSVLDAQTAQFKDHEERIRAIEAYKMQDHESRLRSLERHRWISAGFVGAIGSFIGALFHRFF
jgi:hypothetical protein